MQREREDVLLKKKLAEERIERKRLKREANKARKVESLKKIFKEKIFPVFGSMEKKTTLTNVQCFSAENYSNFLNCSFVLESFLLDLQVVRHFWRESDNKAPFNELIVEFL